MHIPYDPSSTCFHKAYTGVATASNGTVFRNLKQVRNFVVWPTEKTLKGP